MAKFFKILGGIFFTIIILVAVVWGVIYFATKSAREVANAFLDNMAAANVDATFALLHPELQKQITRDKVYAMTVLYDFNKITSRELNNWHASMSGDPKSYEVSGNLVVASGAKLPTKFVIVGNEKENLKIVSFKIDNNQLLARDAGNSVAAKIAPAPSANGEQVIVVDGSGIVQNIPATNTPNTQVVGIDTSSSNPVQIQNNQAAQAPAPTPVVAATRTPEEECMDVAIRAVEEAKKTGGVRTEEELSSAKTRLFNNCMKDAASNNSGSQNMGGAQPSPVAEPVKVQQPTPAPKPNNNYDADCMDTAVKAVEEVRKSYQQRGVAYTEQELEEGKKRLFDSCVKANQAVHEKIF